MKITRTLQSWACKALGLSQLAQAWNMGLDMPDSNASKASRPYKQVSLVFTCINKVISAMQGLPLVLSTIDEKIVESGPIYDLLFNSPSLTWQRFVTESIGRFVLDGEVFWLFTEMSGGGPKKIRIIPGSWMHAVTHNNRPGGELIGWEFRGAGGQRAQFGLDEVHQWKSFNPYDRFHGLGAITAAEHDINYTFAAALYNASALANGAEPGAILTTPGKPDEDEVRMLRNHFDARHKGAGHAARTAILTGGMDIKTVAMKLTDLQVAQITEMSDKKICSTFGVPPGVAGLITEAQYSHGPAMQDFVFNTVIPLASLFASEITEGIITPFSANKWLGGDKNFPAIYPDQAKFYSGPKRGLTANRFFRTARHKAVSVQKKVFAWFDAGQHPVVQEQQREQAEKVLKFTDAGVPLNDLIVAHDLPYEERPWGNEWWIGMGQVQASYILDAGLEGITGPPAPETSPPGEEPEKSSVSSAPSVPSVAKEGDEQRKLRIWRNWVTSWLGIEREYQSALRVFFVRQQRILIEKLKKALAESKSAKAEADDIIARIVFDLKIEDGKIRVINHSFFSKASELGIRQTLSEVLGVKGDRLDELTEQAKKRPYLKGKLVISTEKITGINKTTQKLIARQLKLGLDKGEGLSELTKRVQTTLGSNRGRAQNIARTQTAGAVGSGRHTGMKHAGVDKKGWLTAGDEEVRDDHREAGVTYADGIALDMPFIVGGEPLMYPCDPSGSAGNIICCRYVELAKLAAGKMFDLSYYEFIDFLGT